MSSGADHDEGSTNSLEGRLLADTHGLRTADVVDDVIDAEFQVGVVLVGGPPAPFAGGTYSSRIQGAVIADRGRPALRHNGLAVRGGAPPVVGDEADQL